MHIPQKIVTVPCFELNTYLKAQLSYDCYEINALYKVKNLEGTFEFCMYYLNIFMIKQLSYTMLIKKTDTRGRALVDMQLFVLGTLRYIATGCIFNVLDKLTCVAGETHHVFVHDIFSNQGKHTAKENMNLLDSEEEIQHVTGLYERSSHPGCIGSTDCAHVV